VLDLVEEPLDSVARPIEVLAEADRVFAIRFGRNVHPDARRLAPLSSCGPSGPQSPDPERQPQSHARHQQGEQPPACTQASIAPEQFSTFHALLSLLYTVSLGRRFPGARSVHPLEPSVFNTIFDGFAGQEAYPKRLMIDAIDLKAEVTVASLKKRLFPTELRESTSGGTRSCAHFVTALNVRGG